MDFERIWQILRRLSDGRAVALPVLGLTPEQCQALQQQLQPLSAVFQLQTDQQQAWLTSGWQPLSVDQIETALAEQARQFVLQFYPQLDSTSQYLQRALSQGPCPAHRTVLLTEYQTAGQGQRGRSWQALPGVSLTFSLFWQWHRGMAALPGITLVTGLAVVRVCHRLGFEQVGLKWPNDLVTAEGKLGGGVD